MGVQLQLTNIVGHDRLFFYVGRIRSLFSVASEIHRHFHLFVPFAVNVILQWVKLTNSKFPWSFKKIYT